MTLRAALLLSLLVAGEVASQFQLRLRQRTEQELREFREKFADSDLQDRWFEQKLDHFDVANNATWKQRYWRIDEFGTSDGPQFLCISGEGDDGTAYACADAILDYARQLNATVWTLEHRFYGSSQPFTDLSTKNLRFLSSEQAIEDLANFIRTQNIQANITNPQWVLFGGSYPGFLALEARQLHPDLTVGAVGSSAPIEPMVDYYDFNRVAEEALRTVDPACPGLIAEAIAALRKALLTTSGRKQIKEVLEIDLGSRALSYNQTQSLFKQVVFNFNTQHDSVTQVQDTCSAVHAKDPLTRLLGIVSPPETYDEWIAELRSEKAPNWDRAWTWQTCNEFGWFQSTDLGGGIFGDVLPVNWFINACIDTFGPSYNLTYIEAAVQRTRAKYGGRDNYNGTNVVIPNGSFDTWHAAGFYGPYLPGDPSAVVVFMQNTSHCADMEKSDDPEILRAQAIIANNLKKWTGHQITEETTTAIPPNRDVDKALKGKRSEKLRKPRKTHSFIKFGAMHRDSHLVDSTLTSDEQNMLEQFHSRYGFRSLRDGTRSELTDALNVTEGWIQQDLDHFNSSVFQTWKQRFRFTDDYHKPGGPIFLNIGGEWNLDESPLSYYQGYLDYVKQQNGAFYYLEHRYYGHSIPTAPHSVQDVQWLTSEQALADIAVFIESTNRYKGYVNPRWVVLGCSYAGMLSAWFRQAYPSLAVGAVASSAPVQAKVDFFEKYEVTEANLVEYGRNCSEAVRTAVTEVHGLVQSEKGRAQLVRLFGPKTITWNISDVGPEEVGDLFEKIGERFMGASQWGTIPTACQIMTDEQHTALENLARYVGQSDQQYTRKDIRMLVTGSKRRDREAFAWNAWMWQKCTEFGFFPSTDIGHNVFGSTAPVNALVEECAAHFGREFNRSSIDTALERTNAIHGGAKNFVGTNVAFTNSLADPWHALSLLPDDIKDTDNGTVASFVIPGLDSLHCIDATAPSEGASKELTEIRQRVNQLISKWIQ